MKTTTTTTTKMTGKYMSSSHCLFQMHSGGVEWKMNIYVLIILFVLLPLSTQTPGQTTSIHTLQFPRGYVHRRHRRGGRCCCCCSKNPKICIHGVILFVLNTHFGHI